MTLFGKWDRICQCRMLLVDRKFSFDDRMNRQYSNIQKNDKILFQDNLEALKRMDDQSVDLIYIDPPFNTGHAQKRTSIRVVRDQEGDRVGFQGQRYHSEKTGQRSYDDRFDDFVEFLRPRMEEAYRILKNDGSLYFHIDYREVHYCKIMLDEIFGRDSFLKKLSGHTITVPAPKKNGRRNTIIFCFMRKTRIITHSMSARSIEFLIWLPVWSEKKKAKEESFPRIPGGTPSFRQTAKKKPAIRPRNRWVSFEGLLRLLPTPVIWCWIFCWKRQSAQLRRNGAGIAF